MADQIFKSSRNIFRAVERELDKEGFVLDRHYANMKIFKEMILSGQLKINRSSKESNKENIEVNQSIANGGADFAEPAKKPRGRPRHTNALVEKRGDSSSTAKSEESPGGQSLNDSQASSTSSTRSKRAAAQAVGEKMERVKSLMGNKKLRRPTDFDDKRNNTQAVNSPPAKSRRTRRNQSAGSPDLVGPEKEEAPVSECEVLLQRMSTPEVRQHLKRSGSNKRKSEDLFQETDAQPAKSAQNTVMNTTQVIVKKDLKNKRAKGGSRSEVSSSENKMSEPQQISPIVNTSISAALGKAVAHSSPLASESPSSAKEFHGFDVEPTFAKPTRSKKGKQNASAEQLVAENSIHIDQRVTRKTCNKQADDEDMEVVETETNIRSRTKIIRKKDNEEQDKIHNGTYICDAKAIKSPEEESDATESTRSRTKVIKKASDRDTSQESTGSIRSRTKTIKKDLDQKVTGDDLVAEGNQKNKSKATKSSQSSEDEEVLIPRKAMTDKHQKKLVNDAPGKSPATVKGELVRKRVEDFEKITQNKDSEDENPTRVTRHAAKLKATDNKTKKTPMTKIPVTNSPSLVQKAHPAEALEKRMKDEKRNLRLAKELEAAKNKEKNLKATAEETRRKREEKLQKVAAAREAAEREKALQIAKADKEREEKLRQIQAEKEKQKKEEMLKKKLLLQQKMEEVEERKRNEEAARLAKLREQEEERKRAIATKEREMELQNQRAAEQRLEAEKAKAAAKLGKVATINHAKSKMAATTSTPSSAPPPTESYEITPARDERPLLKPKTENDYGIEDACSEDSSEDEDNPRKVIPSWAQAERRKLMLKTFLYVPESLREAFFDTTPKMPALDELFKGFAVKKRIRTSSAVWRTPPLSCRKN